MKIKALDFLFGGKSLTKTNKEKLVFLAVDTSKSRTTYLMFSDREAMPTIEFKTQEELDEYLENDVSKNDREYIRVFKEIDLNK